jgi:hypothetical protein
MSKGRAGKAPAKAGRARGDSGLTLPAGDAEGGGVLAPPQAIATIVSPQSETVR